MPKEVEHWSMTTLRDKLAFQQDIKTYDGIVALCCRLEQA